MIRTIVGASLIGFTSYAAYGQAPAAASAFEVASVKALKMSDIDKAKARDSMESTPGSLTMRNVSLTTCLVWAYDVKEYQISGPSWMTAERYEIVAKAAGPASESQMKPMLQTLLADRFKLTLHREKKEVQVFALVQGKNPPRLQPADASSKGGMKIVGSSVTIPRISMAQLTDMLWKQMDRPVIDVTGLTGFYDLKLDVPASPDGAGSEREQMMVGAKMMMGRSLPQVVQEQLGLRLESRKFPVDALIVDQAERIPTEN